MNQNALLNCDSYKLCHKFMFPDGMTKGYSNFTPRNVKYLNASVPTEFQTDSIVFAGLSGFLQEFVEVWDKSFFSRPVDVVIAEYKEFILPFAGDLDVSHIQKLHSIGYLPLIIKALPEGSRVKQGVPVFTITNTHPDMAWLPNYLETWLSAELWKVSTSATIAALYRKICEKWADITGGNKLFIDWQCHDFSVRGMSGINDAAKTGLGHLLSFTGSDNLPSAKYARDYYDGKSTFVAGSVAASEHSVTTAGGMDNELETLRRFITKFDTGIVSIVSDSFDYWKVITEYSVQLKDIIMNRRPDQFGNAKTVFRPDSGDPVKIICGDPDAPVGSPEYRGSIQCLWDIFGGTTNEKGYRTLDQHVGLIYGDSITIERANEILSRLEKKGFASDNVVFGVGSFTYQHVTRDTCGFAMKMTYAVVDNVGRPIFKDPKTDPGKKSARGLMRVDLVDGQYMLFDEQTEEQEQTGCLDVVFENGKIVKLQSLAEIRERVARG